MRTHPRRTASRLVAAAAGLGLLLTACGGGGELQEEAAASGGDEQDASAPDQVHFILDWIPKGQTSPFYVALEQGFWADRNLSVTISRGYGSGDTAVRVGRGEGDFGWAGVSAVMNTIAEGLPLQEIAATAHRAPGALFSLEHELSEGADAVVGLRGAIDPNTEEASLMRAYAVQEGFDFDEDIDWLFTDNASMEQVVADQADFIADWGTNIPEWWQQDPPLEPNLLWVGTELGIYGNGIISRPEYLEENQDIARRFVEGAVEGYKYVLENGEEGQQEAIDALFKYNPEVGALPGAEEFHLANLKMFLSLMLDDTVKEHGLGYFVPERVDASLDFINTYLLDEPLERDEAFLMDPQILESGDFMIEDWDAAVESVSEVMGRPNPFLAQYPAS